MDVVSIQLLVSDISAQCVKTSITVKCAKYRLPHDHPFIKIVKPEDSPTAIFTAVNENPE
jgi:hypothetical protein